MRILFSFLLAGIAVRLKPTVTALLRRCRVLARADDTLARFTPPVLYIR